MTSREFYSAFSSEELCKAHFKSAREKQGIVCRSCSSSDHRWLINKEQWCCNCCGFRTTLKSGAFLENSNLKFNKWYEAFHLMCLSKKPISAKTLQRQLSVGYSTSWFLLQRIRVALGRRNRDYTLEGEIEVDETMMSVMDLSSDANKEMELQKDLDGKPPQKKTGRGAAKAKILVMASYNYYFDRKGRKRKGLAYASMEVLDNFKSEEIGDVMKGHVDVKSKIFTDAFSSYKPLKEKYEHLQQDVASGIKAVEKLPIVHRLMANMKNSITRIHHSVSQLFLQNYLDEFCFKLNRSKFFDKMFQRVALQVVRFRWNNSR